MFNELRSDLVLLYELKQACANCEYELQMLRHRHEALARAGVLGGPATPASGPTPTPAEPVVPEAGLGPDPSKDSIIDVVGAPLTPNSVSGWTEQQSTSRPLGSPPPPLKQEPALGRGGVQRREGAAIT